MTEEEQSYKRSWLAIGLATLVVMVSYSSLLVAIVASRSDTPEASGPAFALGFALVPIAYVALAFVSGRRNAPMQVLKAMGVWLVVGMPLVLANPIFGLAVGYGSAGVPTLRVRPTDSWKARIVAVLLVAAYSLAMLQIIPPLGLLSGGLLPLASLGLADYYTQNRAKTAGGAG